MKIGIISDTHCRDENCSLELTDKYFKNVDLIIHAGDIGHISCLKYLSKFAEVIAVAGNNDYSLNFLNEKEIIKIGNVTIGVTHGHLGYENSVKQDAYRLLKEADVIIFGHTHKPLMEEFKGKLVINPGSFNRPRTFDRRKSIAMLTINEDIDAKIIKL